MSERTLGIIVDEFRISAYTIVPAPPNILSMTIDNDNGYGGETLRIAGIDALEAVRRLHFAIGRIIAQAEEANLNRT